nr:MAG TPA: hypothetical protein [Caudoviricetes sp.]
MCDLHNILQNAFFREKVFFCALENTGGVRGDVLLCGSLALPPLPLALSLPPLSLAPRAFSWRFFTTHFACLSLVGFVIPLIVL